MNAAAKEGVTRTNATISEGAIRARAARVVAMLRVTEMSLAVLRAAMVRPAATVEPMVIGIPAAMVRPATIASFAARGLAAMLK